MKKRDKNVLVHFIVTGYSAGITEFLSGQQFGHTLFCSGAMLWYGAWPGCVLMGDWQCFIWGTILQSF